MTTPEQPHGFVSARAPAEAAQRRIAQLESLVAVLETIVDNQARVIATRESQIVTLIELADIHENEVKRLNETIELWLTGEQDG